MTCVGEMEGWMRVRRFEMEGGWRCTFLDGL